MVGISSSRRFSVAAGYPCPVASGYWKTMIGRSEADAMALKCASTMSAVWPSANGAGGNTSSAEDPPACARFAIRAASRLPSAQMPWISGSRSPISLPAMSSTRLCSSAVHEATSVECALIVIADKPSTSATSRKWLRKPGSSIERSSWNGSSTAGITPWGTKSLKRAMAISRMSAACPVGGSSWKCRTSIRKYPPHGNKNPALLHDGDALPPAVPRGHLRGVTAS